MADGGAACGGSSGHGARGAGHAAALERVLALVDERAASRWAPVDRLIRACSHHFPLLASATPVNAAAEQRRLEDDWRLGRERSPSWVASTADPLGQVARLDVLRAGLGRLSAELMSDESSVLGPWGRVYAGRLEEMERELSLVAALFTPRVLPEARRRFEGAEGAASMERADALAHEWLGVHGPTGDDAEPVGRGDDDAIPSDADHDPRSLASRMRASLAAHRVGVRVVVSDRVGALAAAGDGVVVIARGRRISSREVERVVLHEVEGHILPRERARGTTPGVPAQPVIAVLGSACASEDEEGRAVMLEERAGHLGSTRRRALALRHVAARMVASEACYVDVVRALRDVHGAPIEQALAIASRVHRGGYRRGRDVFGGIARERVYLPAYLRVRDAVDARWSLDLLGQRRLSIGVLDELVRTVAKHSPSGTSPGGIDDESSPV